MTEEFVQEASPDEVFAALSDETRVAILQSLQSMEDKEASFSTLREAVGMDDPGQFNYHLGTLTGRFVAKTESGYRLTQAGKQITSAIASGAYTVEGAFEPLALDSTCQACGGAQTLRYEDEVVRVECESCPTASAFAVPPAVFADCEREAIPAVASRYLRATVDLQYNGFCPYCNSRVQQRVAALTSLDIPNRIPEGALDDAVESPETTPWVQFDCQRCGATGSANLAGVLLAHPAVAGFYHRHGIDVSERPVWAFPPQDSLALAIPQRDPFRAAVTYREGGEECRIVVDDRLDVVETDC